MSGRKVLCLRTFFKIYVRWPAVIARYPEPIAPSAGSAAIQCQCSRSGGRTAALQDREFCQMCLRENEAGRAVLCAGLEQLGLPTWGGQANFVLCKVGDGVRFFQDLQRRGVIVRPLAPYGMAEYVRITIGRSEENARLLAEVAEWIDGEGAA